MIRKTCLAGLVLSLGLASSILLAQAPVEPGVRAALDRISADSLKGHVSFLASDLLEGRGTPSRGLDIAAEYIASQFLRAGLEPLGDDGYFQTAPWKYAAPDPSEFSLEVRIGDRSFPIGFHQVDGSLNTALKFGKVAATKVDDAAMKSLKPEDTANTVFLAEPAKPPAVLNRFAPLRPLLVLEIGPDTPSTSGLSRPGDGRVRFRPSYPVIRVHSSKLLEAYKTMPAGEPKASVTVNIGEPKEREAKVRNVVGLLRGSDPVLKDTYILVTAHYDHLGIVSDPSGDHIRNGANDDASGTASVMEIAQALSTLPKRPRRSIVFMAFYGEEHGLVGSQYYAKNPVVPLNKTVAGINLEQVGRTDDSEGPRVSGANVTGFDYSDVGAILKAAGDTVGIKVEKHPQNSDRFFFASDNAALARVGIPAHTVSVAYLFPDYHGAKDEWRKLDYPNMAKVDRMVALGLYRIADAEKAPQWNPDNPKAKPFRDKAAGR